MRLSSSLPLITSLTVLLLTWTPAQADQRPWVWTYGSALMEPGAAEIEHYLTLQSPDWSRRADNLRAVHQLEVEIGMGERLDAAVYQVFARDPGAPLDWEGFKLRLRWRLARDPDAFGHPVLYLEHENDASLSASVWEAKLLLSQRWRRVDLALNPVAEFTPDELEFTLAAGLNLRVTSLLGVGAEVRVKEDALWLGPVLSHGGDGLWMALGAGWRVGAEPGETTHEVRLIMGVQVKD